MITAHGDGRLPAGAELHQPADLMGVIRNRATIRCRRDYQEIAGILEAGKFHMAFVDDRLAMPDRYGNDHAHAVEYGIRCVKGEK